MELRKTAEAMSSIKEYPLATRQLLFTVLKHSTIGFLLKVSWKSQLICGVAKRSKYKWKQRGSRWKWKILFGFQVRLEGKELEGSVSWMVVDFFFDFKPTADCYFFVVFTKSLRCMKYCLNSVSRGKISAG